MQFYHKKIANMKSCDEIYGIRLWIDCQWPLNSSTLIENSFKDSKVMFRLFWNKICICYYNKQFLSKDRDHDCKFDACPLRTSQFLCYLTHAIYGLAMFVSLDASYSLLHVAIRLNVVPLATTSYCCFAQFCEKIHSFYANSLILPW